MVLAAGLIPFLVGRDLVYKKSSLAVLALLFTRKKRTTPKTLTEILGAYYCEVFKEYLRDDCTEKAPGVFYVKNEHILYTPVLLAAKSRRKREMSLCLDFWTTGADYACFHPSTHNPNPETCLRQLGKHAMGN